MMSGGQPWSKLLFFSMWWPMYSEMGLLAIGSDTVILMMDAFHHRSNRVPALYLHDQLLTKTSSRTIGLEPTIEKISGKPPHGMYVWKPLSKKLSIFPIIKKYYILLFYNPRTNYTSLEEAIQQIYPLSWILNVFHSQPHINLGNFTKIFSSPSTDINLQVPASRLSPPAGSRSWSGLLSSLT